MYSLHMHIHTHKYMYIHMHTQKVFAHGAKTEGDNYEQTIASKLGRKVKEYMEARKKRLHGRLERRDSQILENRIPCGSGGKRDKALRG